MTVIIILIIVIVLVTIAVAVLKAKGSGQTNAVITDSYYLRQSLFSPAERSFLGILETLGYENLKITSKVRLADIFGIKKGLGPANRQRALNRISAKHVDFLLIKSSDGQPILGIELDDSSHEEGQRIARDAFVDSVFSSAGLPLLHVAAKVSYDPKDIHKRIEEAISRATN